MDDLRAILRRAQQVAGQQPAPPATGGIAGEIRPATGTTPPSQIGHIYFSNTTSDGSGTEAGDGGMDVSDYRLGITVSLWDSSTCGATNHPFSVIKLGGDEGFYNGNVQLYAHDIERTHGPERDRVTRGGGKGQLAGKISCVRIERNHRLS